MPWFLNMKIASGNFRFTLKLAATISLLILVAMGGLSTSSARSHSLGVAAQFDHGLGADFGSGSWEGHNAKSGSADGDDEDDDSDSEDEDDEDDDSESESSSASRSSLQQPSACLSL